MAPNPDWRATNTTIRILDAAEKGHYGVLATIAYNIEHILGMVRAAEQARSPLIVQFFPWAINFSSGLLIRSAALAAAKSSVPIAIHLDHAQDEEMIRNAADMGAFDSIMVDMSHFEKEKNLGKTRELVAYCHERGVACEAEPGRIEGGEDGVMDTEGLEGKMTTMDEVEDFIATGVEFLAPAIGNMHGEDPYGTSGPQLDFARLKQIRTQINGRVRIALHGTNTFEPELMKECIQQGVAKVNVNRLALDGYMDHLKKNAGKTTHTKLMEGGVDEVIKDTMRWMQICGSAGKA